MIPYGNIYILKTLLFNINIKKTLGISLPEDERTRELPISLQGIEIILQYLSDKGKETSSIRNISNRTDLSMRVVKNVLLQLEKFNQVERYVEKNKILPKWRITKFGKKVLKEAHGIGKQTIFQSWKDELIYNITIPERIEKLKDESKAKLAVINSKLNLIQNELSKLLGTVLNLDNPAFEDLLGFIIKKVKFLKQKVSHLPSDPLAEYTIKKKGEKEKKFTKGEEKLLFVEIHFFNSLILNGLNRITEFYNKLSQYLEKESISKSFSVAKDLREEIRTLTNLFNHRENVSIDTHVLSIENLKQISKNKINIDILDEIIDIPITKEEQRTEIEKIVLKFQTKLSKGEKQINNLSTEITENIPLFALYQLILDENPNLNIPIEQLEQVVNELADKGYISGMMVIQGDEDHYLKVVQLKAHDISKDEQVIIAIALKYQAFSLADMVEATGWNVEKVQKGLAELTELGILKYSKSLLQGERWYIVSENNT